jgi:hypothetical protein
MTTGLKVVDTRRIAHVQKVGNKFRIGSAYVRAYDEKR